MLWLAKIKKPMKMTENPTSCLVSVLMEGQNLDYIPLKIGIIPVEIAVIFRDKADSRPQAGLSLNSNQS